MVCHARSASASRRRQHTLRSHLLPPLALLDIEKPPEREAHDFLLRATGRRDRIWQLLDIRRHGTVLLCVVRWIHPEDIERPFSLAEVSLVERAVSWRDHKNAATARAEMEQRRAVP